MKVQKSEQIKTTASPETPDWVLETPCDTTYDLTMFDSGGDPIEDIDLTRDEYIALKHHLAKMRGYDITPPKHPVDPDSSAQPPSTSRAPKSQGRRNQAKAA